MTMTHTTANPDPIAPTRPRATCLVPLTASRDEFIGEINEALAMVLAENQGALARVDCTLLESVAVTIRQAERVFVAGEGRSGLAVRMVAMRLMHLGCRVHVIGETTTPAMGVGDVLIAFSGSGSTGVVSLVADKARTAGGQVLAVTTQPNSPLGKLATQVLTISAASKHDSSQARSQQFAGSLFEQSVLLLFDALFHALSATTQQDAHEPWARHTNLE